MSIILNIPRNRRRLPETAGFREPSSYCKTETPHLSNLSGSLHNPADAFFGQGYGRNHIRAKCILSADACYASCLPVSTCSGHNPALCPIRSCRTDRKGIPADACAGHDLSIQHPALHAKPVSRWTAQKHLCSAPPAETGFPLFAGRRKYPIRGPFQLRLSTRKLPGRPSSFSDICTSGLFHICLDFLYRCHGRPLL